MKRSSTLAALVAALFAFQPLASRAQDGAKPRDGLTVTVHGQARQTADVVEVEVVVSATAEEAAEAEKKYRDKLAKVLGALKGETTDAKRKKKSAAAADTPPAPRKTAKPKKAEEDDDEEEAPKKKKPEEKKPEEKKAEEKKPEEKGEEKKPEEKKGDEDAKDESAKIPVEIREEGLTIGAPVEPSDNMQAMVIRRMQGGTEAKKDPTFRVASHVIARIKGVASIDRGALRRRVAGLIDKAVDAGAMDDGGVSPGIRFLVENVEAFRQRAYSDALEKARNRAGDLAKACGRKLGKVLAVRDVGRQLSSSDAAAQGATKAVLSMAVMFGEAAAPGTAPSSLDLGAEVELQVEFAFDD